MNWGNPRAWTILSRLTIVAGLTLMVGPALADNLNLPSAVDLNPDPGIFETNLTAVEATVDMGNGVTARAETFNGAVPGPAFKLKVGDRVIVHFTNYLPEAASIHWHGIEVPAFSDGTGITQNPVVASGGTYTYRFIARRPGVYFYHSHIKPTNQSFRGFYGPMVIEDPAEQKLVARGLLPNTGHTKTLVIGDVTVCKAAPANDAATFPADPNISWAGTELDFGTFPGLSASPSPKDLCESPIDHEGLPLQTGPLAVGAIPNIEPAHEAGCASTPTGCRTNEGQLVMTNGRTLQGRRYPTGPVTADKDMIPVKSGEGFRLQLASAAATRYLRLRMTGPTGVPVTLFRVGGQGGLLDRVRVESITQALSGTGASTGNVNFEGEILLAVAERQDVVFIVPQGNQGDIFTLWTLDFQRIGSGGKFSGLPTVAVAHFQIVGSASRSERFTIAAGDPVRLHPSVNAPVENLKLLATNPLTPPPNAGPGSTDTNLRLTNDSPMGLPSIDSIDGFEYDVGAPGTDFSLIPHLTSSRFAKVGDILELSVSNQTGAHHPWHAHGFSFQPVKLMSGSTVVKTFDYQEFIDLIDIPNGQTLYYRVRLDDRLKDDFVSNGGAVGRWAMHCHIFFHAGLGMITELAVLP